MARGEQLDTNTAAALRRVIREELILAPTDALPPPNDPIAERAVLSALLCGHIAHADLPLDGSHFYRELHARIFEVTKRSTDIEAIANSAEKQGFCGDLREELYYLRDYVRFYNRTELIHWANVLKQLAAARKLIACIVDLNARLRSGDLDYYTAAPQLLRVLDECDALAGVDRG